MKRLFAAAAFAPLCLAAHQAHAQTQINSASTTPLVSSSAFNIEITNTGSVVVVTGGPAVTIDSDHTLTTNGPISVRNSPTGGTAVLVVTPTEGLNSKLTINSNLIADDTVTNSDTDRDGDLDGVFVPDNVVRYGLRITGDGPFKGDILTADSSTIAVEGNLGSAGVLIETPLTGTLDLNGAIGVLGSNTFGVRLQGPVTGNVSIGGVVNAQGENAVGVQIDGPVDGILRFDGQVTTTGFRYREQSVSPVDPSKLDADDLLIGGPAIRLSGNMTKGLIIDAPPLDVDQTDEDDDDDGVPDANEGSALIQSFGSAPGILIGHATDKITIGETGAGPFPTLGIHINGTVEGNGAYDGITGTAMRIGGLGGEVDVAGGMYVRGGITGGAFNADATGLVVGTGTTLPVLVTEGGSRIRGLINLSQSGNPIARALVIEQGATLGSLFNFGDVRAGVTGVGGTAVAVLDNSGTLKDITQSGTVIALLAPNEGDTATPVGTRIAFDLRTNTSGVKLTQSHPGGDPNTVPQIFGDILLGHVGDDVLKFESGRLTGAVDFGGGDDILTLDAGTTSRVDLRKSAGKLDMTVGGDLTLTNTNRVALNTLSLGSTGVITFTADPQNADAARRGSLLDVGGDAILGQGSRVDLEFISKLNGLTTFEVLRAGKLVNEGLDTTLVNDLPVIFAGSSRINGNSLLVDVRPRTAGELGLRDGRAAAYNAFYAAFDSDPEVATIVFGKKTEADFGKLFDQFLPDYSGGPFNGLANTTRAVFQAQGEEVRDMVPGEPRSWLQEVGVGTKFESVNDIDYQTGGFGVAGGIEHQLGANQFWGFSGSFMTSEIRNANRALGSLLTGSAFMSSIYWRAQEGPMVIDASFGGAYAWFESDRRIVDQARSGAQNLIRQASADWSGAIAAARLGVSYNWTAGPFYVKHDAVLDGVFVREGGYTESGGGQAVNLVVGERETYEVAAEAGILLGARFGRTFRWGPELRVAYRGQLDGGEGDTIARFVSTPDQPFILPGLVKDRQRIVVRASLRGSGAYSNFAFEASGDIGEIYQAYMARFVVRFLF